MTRVVYLPVVSEERELTDLLSRAAWFLGFCDLERISVPVAEPRLAEAEWTVAPGMDPAIADRFERLRELVELVPVAREADVDAVVERASTVLRFSGERRPDWISAAAMSRWLAGRQLFEVDPASVRTEGGNYIDVSFKLSDQARLAADGEARFAELNERLGSYERGFVLATGPSIGEYPRFDYDGALAVACNTVILDDALMERVDPQFVVFADPVFHFGPSQFAASFRRSLLRAAERWSFTVCIPLKYLPIFVAAVPELAGRTAGVPFRKEREFNFDLRSDFELKTTANVLTFVMLPLAATFAREIGILGCDGRPLDEDTHFWSHNAKTQINDKMANVREVHPAFFAIDYNDYYLEHCRTLEEQLEAGERAGRRFSCLASSHIPALARRAAGGAPSAQAPPANGSRNGGRPRFPRLLVLDSTRVGGLNATGQVKKNLLAGWPDDAFLQVCVPNRDRFTLARAVADPATDSVVTAGEAGEAIEAFAPEVVYYRPTIDLHPQLHELARELLRRSPVPVVTHLMDDWPRRLAARDPGRGREVDEDLRELLSRSRRALSISEKMATAFGERYGVEFEPIANGVDPDRYRAASAAAEPVKEAREEVVLRYCGALAKDMTFDTVVDVARAVDRLQGEVPVRFEVYTMPTWRLDFERAVDGLRGTEVADSVPDDEYPALLAEADVLVLGYNFDPESLRYVGLSMPNKLPEYLGSGAAVLAVGPQEAAGIDVLASRELGCCVCERDPDRLAAAIRRLAADGAHRVRVAAEGQAWAFEHLDVRRIARRFQAILDAAADRLDATPILGPFARAERASVDESGAVAELLARVGSDGVLVDVGAHQGSSLAPFAEAGWTVLACEPDHANRSRLVERFGDRESVTIDARAVSEAPAAGAPFFSSEESTGISALHAFRPTHRRTATVDVTTVGELVGEHGLSRIDFLKIDVEGFDLSVLRGVPWDRVKPGVVVCEFEDAKTVPLGHTHREIADLLAAEGYSVYLSEWHPVVRYGIRHDWRRLVRYPCALASNDAWGNVVAFRSDPGADALRRSFTARLDVRGPAARNGGGETASPTPARRPAPGPGAVPAPAPTTRSAVPARPVGPAHGSSRYERVYLWALRRGPLAFAAGRLAMWCARKVRRYPRWAAAYAALVAVLVALGFWDGIEPFGPLLWVAAGLLALGAAVVVSTGYSTFLLKEAVDRAWWQREGERRRSDAALDSLRSELRADRRALEERLGAIEAASLSRLEELEARAEAAHGERRASADALAARIDELSRAVEDVRAELAQPRVVIQPPGSEDSIQVACPGPHDADLDRPLDVAYAGSDGLQAIAEPRVQTVLVRGHRHDLAVTSLTPLDAADAHVARWLLEPPAGAAAVTVLISTRSRGSWLAELAVGERGGTTAIRVDLETGAPVEGAGPADSFAVDEAEDGWRICTTRFALGRSAGPLELRLSLIPDAGSPPDRHRAEPGGATVTEPLVLVE